MGVYIKGMEMPTSCLGCTLVTQYYDGGCDVCCLLDTYASKHGTLDDCPLVPVPPHGRLIDADALLSLLDKCMFPSDMVTTSAVRMATNWIKDAPTVIEAEGGE